MPVKTLKMSAYLKQNVLTSLKVHTQDMLPNGLFITHFCDTRQALIAGEELKLPLKAVTASLLLMAWNTPPHTHK